MMADEFRIALKDLKIRQRWLAGKPMMSPQTINRWATGELPVPPWVPYLVELLLEREARQWEPSA